MIAPRVDVEVETTLPHSDEYQVFLGQVNILTERRQLVTTTYLSVNTAIVGAMAFLFKDGQLGVWTQQASVLVLLTAGLIACSLWRRLIVQYNTLLGWWYAQLRDLEAAMPSSQKLLTREYHALYAKKPNRAPVGLSRYETRLAWLFTLLYFAFGAAIVVTLVLSLI